MNLANYITIFRLIMIPVFLILISWEFYPAALIIFIIASAGDAVDGFIARKTKSITPLGRFIDPMADKLLLVSAFVSLTILGKIPVWLTVIVISRDIILFVGWLGIYIVTGVKSINPSIVSKITTFIQMVTIVAVMLNMHIKDFIFNIAALLTTISGLHYVIRTAVKLPEYINSND